MREADADSSKRARSGEYRQSHDKNCDETGLFALHARRFYTDCGTIRSRHANRSVERKSHVSFWAAQKDVESNCLQSGMGRFGHRSGKLRLQVAALNCCKNIYIAKDPSTLALVQMAKRIRENWRAEDHAAAQAQRAAAEAAIKRLESVAA